MQPVDERPLQPDRLVDAVLPLLAELDEDLDSVSKPTSVGRSVLDIEADADSNNRTRQRRPGRPDRCDNARHLPGTLNRLFIRIQRRQSEMQKQTGWKTSMTLKTQRTNCPASHLTLFSQNIRTQTKLLVTNWTSDSKNWTTRSRAQIPRQSNQQAKRPPTNHSDDYSAIFADEIDRDSAMKVARQNRCDFGGP